MTVLGKAIIFHLQQGLVQLEGINAGQDQEKRPIRTVPLQVDAHILLNGITCLVKCENC